MLLPSYYGYISEFFTDVEVAEIHSAADRLQLDDGRVGFSDGNDPDAPEEDNVRHSVRQGLVKWFAQEGEHSLPKHLTDKIHDGVAHVVKENGWTSWEYNYLEPLQYTIYNARNDKPTGDFYTWHTDAGTEPYANGLQRKLSFTIQLSHPDEYEGGHFEWLEPHGTFDKLTAGQRTINVDDIVRTSPFSAKEKGSLLVFPSFVHHQVKPVTTGTRISLVGWLVGKPYI